MLWKYYPVWLLIILLSDFAYATMDLNLEIRRGWINLFVTDSIAAVFVYLMVISALCIIKPDNIPVRIFVMVASMLLSVSFSTFIICRINDLPPMPFSGMDQVTSLFIGYFTSGICIIWFLSIEEKQYAAEKKIVSERIKIALNEKKVMENQLRLLQAQIEPHFLFNTLTSIVSLGKKNPPKAKAMQSHLIDYLESTIDKTRSSITTIVQEVELLRSYLKIFKVRMGKRLSYTIEVDDAIGNLPFPSMLIQPIVENSIKHGLEPKIEGGEICVKAERSEEDTIRWTIIDTGLGLSDSVKLGTGLSNVMERVESLYGRAGNIVFTENHPSGLKVVLEVPYV